MSATKPSVSGLQTMVGLAFVTAMLWLLFSPESPVNAGAKVKEGAVDAPVAPVAPVDLRPRVACTSPAITDSLVELGLAGHIVGRSGFCRSVDASVPVVGDLRDFDAERLAACRPDVLFVQPPLAGVDPRLRDLCARLRLPIVDRRIDTLADLDRLVDDVSSAFMTPPDPAGEGLALRLAEAKALLAATPAPDAAAARPALLLVSAEPFLAVGRGNYLDELLARAGLANAFEREGYVELGAEALLALLPERILVVTETELGAARAGELLAALPWPEGKRPRVAARAVPELLSPSLVALRKVDALAALAAEAR